jgi:phage-related protein (TIGR01555 family)
VNLAAGLGGPRDKRSVGGYAVPIRLDQQTLENIYAGRWHCRPHHRHPAGDMTRKGWTRSWDDADKDPNVMRQVEAAEKKAQLPSRAFQALKWGGLYGGCLLVAMMRGANMAEPLKLEAVKKNSLLRFQVLDRWRVTPSSRIDDNPESPGFGLPLFYTMAESSVVIHNSRVARFIGRDAPYWQLRADPSGATPSCSACGMRSGTSTGRKPRSPPSRSRQTSTSWRWRGSARCWRRPTAKPRSALALWPRTPSSRS